MTVKPTIGPIEVAERGGKPLFFLVTVSDILFIFIITTLIISKKPGNTGISRDIRTEFTTDLLLSD